MVQVAPLTRGKLPWSESKEQLSTGSQCHLAWGSSTDVPSTSRAKRNIFSQLLPFIEVRGTLFMIPVWIQSLPSSVLIIHIYAHSLQYRTINSGNSITQICEGKPVWSFLSQSTLKCIFCIPQWQPWQSLLNHLKSVFIIECQTKPRFIAPFSQKPLVS